MEINSGLTTSNGTKYTHETRFETIPATPFAIAILVASGIFDLSIYLSVISFDTSSEVKANTLPGNAPTAEVPNPLKIPGTPSYLRIFLKTVTPFMRAKEASATCIRVFTTAVGCNKADCAVKRKAPIM